MRQPHVWSVIIVAISLYILLIALLTYEFCVTERWAEAVHHELCIAKCYFKVISRHCVRSFGDELVVGVCVVLSITVERFSTFCLT